MFKRCYLLFRSQAAKQALIRRVNNLLRKFCMVGEKGCLFDLGGLLVVLGVVGQVV